MRIEVSSEYADLRLEMSSTDPGRVRVIAMDETEVCCLPLSDLVAMVRVLAAGVPQT